MLIEILSHYAKTTQLRSTLWKIWLKMAQMIWAHFISSTLATAVGFTDTIISLLCHSTISTGNKSGNTSLYLDVADKCNFSLASWDTIVKCFKGSTEVGTKGAKSGQVDM